MERKGCRKWEELGKDELKNDGTECCCVVDRRGQRRRQGKWNIEEWKKTLMRSVFVAACCHHVLKVHFSWESGLIFFPWPLEGCWGNFHINITLWLETRMFLVCRLSCLSLCTQIYYHSYDNLPCELYACQTLLSWFNRFDPFLKAFVCLLLLFKTHFPFAGRNILKRSVYSFVEMAPLPRRGDLMEAQIH